MQRLSRLILVFWFFIGIFIKIVACYMIEIVFNLAQIFVTLLFILFHIGSITTRGKGIRKLSLFTSIIRTKIFFR